MGDCLPERTKTDYESISPFEQDDEKRELRRLSARDSSLFIAESESDAPPNKALKEAVKKFRQRYPQVTTHFPHQARHKNS